MVNAFLFTSSWRGGLGKPSIAVIDSDAPVPNLITASNVEYSYRVIVKTNLHNKADFICHNTRARLPSVAHSIHDAYQSKARTIMTHCVLSALLHRRSIVSANTNTSKVDSLDP